MWEILVYSFCALCLAQTCTLNSIFLDETWMEGRVRCHVQYIIFLFLISKSISHYWMCVREKTKVPFLQNYIKIGQVGLGHLISIKNQ